MGFEEMLKELLSEAEAVTDNITVGARRFISFEANKRTYQIFRIAAANPTIGVVRCRYSHVLTKKWISMNSLADLRAMFKSHKPLCR